MKRFTTVARDFSEETPSAQRPLKIIAYILLAAISIAIAFVISKSGLLVGGAFVFLSLSLPFFIACFIYPRFGFLLTLGTSYFITYFKRITYSYDAPFGIILEILIYVAALGALFRMVMKKDISFSSFKNPVAIAILVWMSYLFIQAFNPSTPTLAGWLLTMRGAMMYLVFYFVALYSFNDLRFIRFFTIFWVVLALLSALYGIYQEYVGFPDYDLRWVYSSTARYRLNFIWGRFRKWSFLSDSMSFGVFMAFSGIFCLVLLLGPYNPKKKLLLGISSILMFMAMAFSGTRTAYAMVPVGVAIFILMTINNYKSLIFAFTCFSVFAFLIFGPIQNPILNRIRSAFDEDDASLQVRNLNRGYIQPFIWEHPIGGGLLTTGDTGLKYYPDHELAGFASDSGFLKTALETGWIGLILQVALYFVALAYGVNSFYKCRSPEIRILLAAYIASFFAITLANFTQVASSKYPMGLLIFCIYALFIKLKELAISIEKQPEVMR